MAGAVGRRRFIALLGGASLASIRPASAQPQRVRRVGMLFALEESDPEARNRIRSFRLGMRDLGWIEGRSVEILPRFAGSDLRSIEKQALELTALAPDVIVANSTPTLAALTRTKTAIPIVFAMVTDPVGQGFISSLAHPGGSITGFTFIEPELVGKWISLLSDVKPDLARTALMFNPDTAPFFDPYFESFKASRQQTAVAVEVAHVRTVAEIEPVVAKLAREPGSALIAGSDVFLVSARAALIELTAKYRLPVISPYRQWVAEGSLMSYGPDTGDILRRASDYVARVLKGELPGNLPAQSPIKYELAINIKTAKALGLTVRDAFLELADEVVE